MQPPRVCMLLGTVIIPLVLFGLLTNVGAQGRGQLGVFIQNVPQIQEADGGPLRVGVVVLGVMRNSPAEQGGLQRGDIIVRFNGQPVRRVEDLQRLVGDIPLGETAELEINRGDQTLRLPVKIDTAQAVEPLVGPSLLPPILQRDELLWIVLGGAGILLLLVYLSSMWPRQRTPRVRTPTVDSRATRLRFPRYILSIGSAGTLGIIALWSSLSVIEAGHRGVVFNLVRGVQPVTLAEGIHLLPPILNRVTVYDIRSRIYHVQSRSDSMTRGTSRVRDHLLWAPTADGLKVGLDLSVRFRLDPGRLPELHRGVGPEFEEKIVHPIVWNVTRLVVSEYSLLEVYGKRRQEIQQQALSRVQAMFARDGLIVEDLLLRDVVYTREFEKTVVAKMVAEQKVQEADFEVQQAALRAQVQVIESQGEAQALELVNAAIREQPLLLQYLWLKNLPERVKIVVVPTRGGKVTPTMRVEPPKGQPPHSVSGVEGKEAR